MRESAWAPEQRPLRRRRCGPASPPAGPAPRQHGLQQRGCPPTLLPVFLVVRAQRTASPWALSSHQTWWKPFRLPGHVRQVAFLFSDICGRMRTCPDVSVTHLFTAGSLGLVFSVSFTISVWCFHSVVWSKHGFWLSCAEHEVTDDRTFIPFVGKTCLLGKLELGLML